MDDLISRQAALEKVRTMQTYKLFVGDDMILIDKADVQTELMMLPSVQPEPKWIPVERELPEEDVDVLIAYRYKGGEGDTSHTCIGITTYGHMHYGGIKVVDCKHWREPFEYFESNYEVIAWMPLPERYKGG